MNKTHKLVCVAMLTALSIVANFCTIQLPGNSAISFTLAICFFTGIYFGPLAAAIVGYMGDLIAHLINPMGAYNWFMALSITLYGVICALVYKARLPKIVNLLISAAICYIICLCGLNTFGLWLQYVVGVKSGIFGIGISGVVEFITMDQSGIKKSFWVYLATRAPMSAVNLTVNTVIVAGLQASGLVTKLMRKVRNKNTTEQADKANEVQQSQEFVADSEQNSKEK
ncbi:MAG: folate family ECF transporter S component [Clostridiales bacterium]|nr:folate family ECF transporter S component [Clostridiales bacterium]